MHPLDKESIWEPRERITDAYMCDGFLFSYDLSLPYANYYELVEKTIKHLSGCSSVVRICGHGHIGDGNLHLNITSKEYDHEILDLMEPFVFEWTSKLGGSVSAEHGIGFKKTKFIHYSKSHSSLNLMKDIKKIMDPNGILNPYKGVPLSLSHSLQISSPSGISRNLSNLVEVGLNPSGNQVRCSRETGDWSGPKPTSSEQGLASRLPAGWAGSERMLWDIRERVAEALLSDGYWYTYDLSLPHKHFYDIVGKMEERLSNHPKVTRISGLGHLGKEFDQEVFGLIEPFVFEWTSKLRGSVSAEHGIGFTKTKFIHFSKFHGGVTLGGQVAQGMGPMSLEETLRAIMHAAEDLETSVGPRLGDQEGEEEMLGVVDCFGLPRFLYRTVRSWFTAEKSVKVNTRFLLVTRNSSIEQEIRSGREFSLADTGFDPRRPTVMIVHGFFADTTAKWMKEMSQALLSQV
uniref:D-2-hydroxyglutarate dehydrogenase, mitochondrial n=1 Tax=Timema douglasi TaxID=61478 RepID=A0A7R8ZAB6_TIMDO|nr:unnamed protein product [Timema douglasi]